MPSALQLYGPPLLPAFSHAYISYKQLAVRRLAPGSALTSADGPAVKVGVGKVRCQLRFTSRDLCARADPAHICMPLDNEYASAAAAAAMQDYTVPVAITDPAGARATIDALHCQVRCHNAEQGRLLRWVRPRGGPPAGAQQLVHLFGCRRNSHHGSHCRVPRCQGGACAATAAAGSWATCWSAAAFAPPA